MIFKFKLFVQVILPNSNLKKKIANVVLLSRWPRGKRNEIVKDILMLMIAGQIVNTV